ncbi:hypothetical protein [Streptomyces sp. NPDC057939]|uniref:hypothetical protein n=1 Tax=Streptomyces sp. NPDC057939 TaxID=3346284 RepID=UPI0036EAA4B2
MDGWDRAGRIAAHGAALALAPYLVIKVVWVAGALAGALPVGQGLGLAEWVVLNTVTVVMAAIGIVMSLALVRPWGMRIPLAPVAFCAWVGSGFLVSLLPFGVLSTLLDAGGGAGGPGGSGSGGSGGDDPGVPHWEGLLLQAGFLGVGLGLTLAVPAYLRRRRPAAFSGRVGDGPRSSRPWGAVLGALVGLVWLHWALGGTIGIAHPDRRIADGYVLGAIGAFWAFAGSAAVWTLARSRPAGLPRVLPLVLGWIGSGSLFAWSAWKLPLTLYAAVARPPDLIPPEHPAVACAVHLAAVLAGAAMLRTLTHTRTPSPVADPPAGDLPDSVFPDAVFPDSGFPPADNARSTAGPATTRFG